MSSSQEEIDTDSIVLTITERVADATGRDPLDLDRPLNRVIDLEALDRLVRSDADVEVTFEYEGCVVDVHGDGSVTVRTDRQEIPG